MLSESYLYSTPFDFKVVGSDGGNVTVQFNLPAQFVEVLPALFESMHGFSRLMKTRSRVVLASARVSDPVEIERRKKEQERFESYVVSKYDIFVSGGLSQREAIRSTRDALRKSGHEGMCAYSVELIIRSAGRLSKRKNKNNFILAPVDKNKKQ